MSALRPNHHQTDTQSGFVRIDADPAAHGTGHKTGHRPGLVALVPGALAPLIGLDLPDGVQGFQREKIAERQLRDLMELSPEHSEIRPFRSPANSGAVSKTNPGSWSQVLIADKAQISDWRRMAAGRCRAILPDYLALPTAPNIWTISYQDGQLSARLGPDEGFSHEPGPAALIVTRALQDTLPKAVLWLGPKLPEIETLFVAADLPVVDTPEAAEALGLPRPVTLQHGELSCDLLLDPQHERDRLRRLVLPWRWPVLLAALAVGLWCTALILETRQLDARAGEIHSEVTRTVRQQFIPQGPILDARAQVETTLQAMRAKVRAQAEKTSPLDLMSRAAGVLAQTGAAVDELSFARTGGQTGGQTGALSVFLRLGNFAALDALSAALHKDGLTVDVVESGLTETGDQVLVELRLGLGEQS